MFFWISRWVSIESYSPIFLQELALVFQVEHQCRVIAYVRDPSSRLMADQLATLSARIKSQ